MARLAEVYVEHDMAPEALDLYEKAAKLAPENAAVQKGMGATLERLHRDGEAQEIWAALFDRAAEKHDRPAQLEARQRLIVIAQRAGRLGIIAGQYREQAMRTRKQDEAAAAAYTLLAADALVKMGRMEMAEELLRTLADEARDPSLRADAWMGLAQVERARHRLGDAVAALKKAAELAPDRGRELYPQIAELSLQLYQDADALSYAKARGAARARRRGGDGASRRGAGEARGSGGRRAGVRARARDRRSAVEGLLHPGAAAHSQRAGGARGRALSHRDAARAGRGDGHRCGAAGDRSRGVSRDAGRARARVVAAGVCARGQAGLSQSIDRAVRPLRHAAGDAGADAGRRRRGGACGAAAPRRAWARPLLDVLVDGEPQQQRVAVALLGAIGNPSAAPALFKLALSRRVPAAAEHDDRTSGVELREEAALAAAEVATARELPMLSKLYAEPEKQVRVAAVYGLGRVADKRAQAQLVSALDDGAVDVQATACLALGAHGSGRAIDAMVAHLKPADGRKPEARIGCAFGLGAAAARDKEPLSAGERAAVRAALAATLGEGADEVQRAAAWALGAVGGDEARPPLVRAVFVKRDEIRRTAALALAHQSQLGARAGRGLPPPERGDDGLDVRATLASLMHQASTPAANAATTPVIDGVADIDAVAAALADALARHRDVVVRALDNLAAARDESEAALWPRVAPSVRPLGTHAESGGARARRQAGGAQRRRRARRRRPRRQGARGAPRRARRAGGGAAAVALVAGAAGAARRAGAPFDRLARAARGGAGGGAASRAVADKGARALAPLRRDPSGFVRQAVR